MDVLCASVQQSMMHLVTVRLKYNANHNLKHGLRRTNRVIRLGVSGAALRAGEDVADILKKKTRRNPPNPNLHGIPGIWKFKKFVTVKHYYAQMHN